MSARLPPEVCADIAHARRLEWWTLGWMASVVAVMGLVMGSSQAMRTAWIEDVLSLIPAIVFLVASQLERRPASRAYPHGFARAHSLGFLISAVALTSVGVTLLFDSVTTLLAAERVTIPPVVVGGEAIWSGWLMIGALLYSIVPPLILGHLKQPIARRLADKVLHTDAMMQKADWMTGLAGVAGVIGVGFGLWWADAAAAGFIAASILKDGVDALRSSTAELIDGAPRALGCDRIADEAEALRSALEARFPGATVRLRESGRFILAQVDGAAPEAIDQLAALWPGAPERAWRLKQVSFVPPCDETPPQARSRPATARAGAALVPFNRGDLE